MADVCVAIALVRDELNDPTLAQRIRRAAVGAKLRLRAIRRSHKKGDRLAPLPMVAAWPTADLAEHRIGLSKRIANLQAEDDSEERKKMRAEHAELADRESG